MVDNELKVHLTHLMFAGGGGEGNTNVMGSFLPECIQVAPDGYDSHWYKKQHFYNKMKSLKVANQSMKS